VRVLARPGAMRRSPPRWVSRCALTISSLHLPRPARSDRKGVPPRGDLRRDDGPHRGPPACGKGRHHAQSPKPDKRWVMLSTGIVGAGPPLGGGSGDVGKTQRLRPRDGGQLRRRPPPTPGHSTKPPTWPRCGTADGLSMSEQPLRRDDAHQRHYEAEHVADRAVGYSSLFLTASVAKELTRRLLTWLNVRTLIDNLLPLASLLRKE